MGSEYDAMSDVELLRPFGPPIGGIWPGHQWVRVRILTHGEAGAAEMTRELQDGGIDGEVRLLLAIPQAVGHGIAVSLGQEAPRRPCNLPEEAPPDLECANPSLLVGDDVSFAGDSFQIRRDAIYLLARRAPSSTSAANRNRARSHWTHRRRASTWTWDSPSRRFEPGSEPRPSPEKA